MKIIDNKVYMGDYEKGKSNNKDTTVFMNDCIMSAYEELSRAVLEKTGNKLYVSSSVRDREEQQALYLEDPLTATVGQGLPVLSAAQTQNALAIARTASSGKVTGSFSTPAIAVPRTSVPFLS